MNSSTPIDQLNPAQRDAVRASATHQLILAGAGSGKTQVLVHRIAWLIQRHQVPPHAILAVTFTNKAAREMRERIETLLGHDIRQMWVGTFHGLAHRLLRLHWHDAGLAEDFQILDSDDQQRLIKRTLRELGLNEEQWPARQAQWFINAQKDEGIRPNRIEPQGDRQLATLVEIYQAYEAACQRANVIDFAELLLRAHELWLNHPELLHHYQNRFRHLLVDEFQDTNSIQYAWIRLLAGGGARVTAVGDDDQSIYGWRGARIENIHRFSRDFADVQTVRLEQNYRSTATILDAANAVIARNRERLGKALWTDGSPGEPIALYTAYNEEDEARFVVGQIRQQLAQGLACREIAILYRSNAQSRLLEEALLRAGIAYRIHGGQRFYERLEIKNALAYLRLMLNRHDDTSLERVLTAPPRGIGGKTLELLRSEARGQQWSLWRAMQQMVTARALPARALTALAAFTQNIDELDRATRDLALSQRVEQVIQRSGLIEFHASERGEKGRGRVENLQELVSASGQFSELLRSEDETLLATAAHDELALLLDSVALDAGAEQGGEVLDAVQLMTLHSAKGLEFPVVFIVGIEEGLFPHQMSLEEPGRLEE
ncbi:MAG TPA: UvrD-helicase domain-containing protein, partial [Pseudomonadales bacterium]|nr:UvrD-helicase domain-containing protein [Pseudomonadales bacterium]